MNEEKIINYFKLLKKDGLLGTSYLFIGDNLSLVLDIIKLINCREAEGACGACWDCKALQSKSHPDLFVVEPEPTSIRIERVRESQGFLALKSYRLPKKVILVKGAENFSLEAANAFLKTLEEPPKHSFIVINASKTDGLLPTIISRCRKIFLPFYGQTLAQTKPALINSFLAGERIKFNDRKEFGSFLATLVSLFRDYLIAEAAPQNNQLLNTGDYEIILQSLRRNNRYNVTQLQEILRNILKVYGAYASVNENLALNMIRVKL
ncbi:MAG: hypothetical protein PHV55_08080 [Candidatus Omnitrophica bacterium]|nr:hypothetical protein [Candidatus Omnitrophota bacterium]